MSHPDARLTPQSRLGLVRGVAGGWTRAEAARRFRVSRATVAKRVRRYRDEGRDGLRDRCPRRAPLAAPRGAARGRGRAPPAPGFRLGAAPHRLGPGHGARPPTPSSAGPGCTAATGGAA